MQTVLTEAVFLIKKKIAGFAEFCRLPFHFRETNEEESKGRSVRDRKVLCVAETAWWSLYRKPKGKRPKAKSTQLLQPLAALRLLGARDQG